MIWLWVDIAAVVQYLREFKVYMLLSAAHGGRPPLPLYFTEYLRLITHPITKNQGE